MVLGNGTIIFTVGNHGVVVKGYFDGSDQSLDYTLRLQLDSSPLLACSNSSASSVGEAAALRFLHTMLLTRPSLAHLLKVASTRLSLTSLSGIKFAHTLRKVP